MFLLITRNRLLFYASIVLINLYRHLRTSNKRTSLIYNLDTKVLEEVSDASVKIKGRCMLVPPTTFEKCLSKADALGYLGSFSQMRRSGHACRPPNKREALHKSTSRDQDPIRLLRWPLATAQFDHTKPSEPRFSELTPRMEQRTLLPGKRLPCCHRNT